MSRIYKTSNTKLWNGFIFLFDSCITTLVHLNNQLFEYKDHFKKKLAGQIQILCVLLSYQMFVLIEFGTCV